MHPVVGASRAHSNLTTIKILFLVGQAAGWRCSCPRAPSQKVSTSSFVSLRVISSFSFGMIASADHCSLVSCSIPRTDLLRCSFLSTRKAELSNLSRARRCSLMVRGHRFVGSTSMLDP